MRGRGSKLGRKRGRRDRAKVKTEAFRQRKRRETIWSESMAATGRKNRGSDIPGQREEEDPKVKEQAAI